MTATFAPVTDVDTQVGRALDLHHVVVRSAKRTALTALDSYDQGTRNLLSFEKELAEATGAPWAKTFAEAHTGFVQGLHGAWVDSARELLK